MTKSASHPPLGEPTTLGAPPGPSPDDPSDQLLDDGQEEVFSRYEVEHGLIEHHSDAGGSSADVDKDKPVVTP